MPDSGKDVSHYNFRSYDGDLGFFKAYCIWILGQWRNGNFRTKGGTVTGEPIAEISLVLWHGNTVISFSLSIFHETAINICNCEKTS